jgi:hypothetical protein
MVFNQRYELALCQKFSSDIHGVDNDSSLPQINNHYLCMYVIDPECSDDFSFALNVLETYNTNIRSSQNITIEIVETYMLYPGYETTAIYKTFWLRIFQRRFRKWFKIKRHIQSMVNTNRIHYMILQRELTGRLIRHSSELI